MATETKPLSASTEVKVLAKGAGIALFAKLGSRGLQLLIQILLARWLGLTGFGLFAIGQNVLQVVSQFGSVGLPTGVIRFGVPAWQKGEQELSELLRDTFFAALLSGLVFGGGTYLLAPWLAVNVFRQPELIGIVRGFGIASAIVIWLNVIGATTRITKRMEYSAIVQDLFPFLLNLILVLIMVYGFRFSVQGAVLAVVYSYAVATALGVFFVGRLFPGIRLIGALSYVRLKDLFAYSIPNLFAGIFNLWLPTVTILLLGYYVSLDQVAIFQAAEQIAMISAIVLLAFTVIFSPIIASLYEQRDMGKLNELFKISTKWGLYASLPLLLVVALMPAQIMTVLYGTDYASGGTLLVVLMFAQLINTVTGAVAAVLSMTHHQNRLLLRVGAAFAFCIVLNVLLIPRWGATGAALALGGAITLLNLSMLFDVHRLLDLWPYDHRYYKMIIALVITSPIVFWVSRIWSAPSIFSLISITLLSIALFGGSLLAFGLEDYERALFATLRKGLRFNV